MNELLFFVLGLVIGGLTGITIMCCMQIKKINEYELYIKKLNGDKSEN